jgi:hypothetical protein
LIILSLERKIPKKTPKKAKAKEPEEKTPKRSLKPPPKRKVSPVSTTAKGSKQKKPKVREGDLPPPPDEDVARYVHREKKPKRPQTQKETPDQKQRRKALADLDKFGGNLFNMNPPRSGSLPQ